VHGNANIGSEKRHETRRAAFAQRPADPQRHVRSRRYRQEQNGNGEGGKCWQAWNEIHRGTHEIWRLPLLNAISRFCQCFCAVVYWCESRRNIKIATAQNAQFFRKLVKAAEYSVCQRESGGRFSTMS
jgi:hypothetical protein